MYNNISKSREWLNHQLCNECNMGIHTRVLHILKWKNQRWLHCALQTYNMYGNPNQSMDDMFLIQIIYIIFQEVSLSWYFSK